MMTTNIASNCDLIVTDGDVLHYQTFVQFAVVDGKQVYDKSEELYFAHIRPRPEAELAPEVHTDPGEEAAAAAEGPEDDEGEAAENESDDEDEASYAVHAVPSEEGPPAAPAGRYDTARARLDEGVDQSWVRDSSQSTPSSRRPCISSTWATA